MADSDVIDKMVGQKLALRQRRPITVTQTQKSYEALFENKDNASFSIADRFAVAAFIALLHQVDEAAQFYLEQLLKIDAKKADFVQQAAKTGLTTGPYGHYPVGPLSREDEDGLLWRADDSLRSSLGDKLIAGFEHGHLLVFHPRDSAKNDIDKLVNAGWSNDDIVTLSQLIAFLSYQIRLVVGLKVLANKPQSVQKR
ncbi:CMD domain protein [Bartonella sp. HY761]|uniref:CMD domain protein n=1 Tax=Bartonella sp. HY761 TaxID=2979330 RepID=UPI00220DD3F6|nr:CMD domain protein [Bartonella sp. HY761]UXN06261.1 CMD domain protein [Bartonella sp. HY761]